MSARRRVLVAAAAMVLAGCVSVSVGTTDAPAVTYYQLVDARSPQARPPAANGARLAVQAVGGDPMADSTALLFSRRAGERSSYQFAAWSERPPRRLAQLVQQRLDDSGRFAVVTQLGQPIATDWLLTLSLEKLLHDVSGTPGQAQLVLRAELIRRADRVRVAQRVFVAAPAVADATAPAAVAAFGEAVSEVLDALTPWVAEAIAANPPR